MINPQGEKDKPQENIFNCHVLKKSSFFFVDRIIIL